MQEVTDCCMCANVDLQSLQEGATPKLHGRNHSRGSRQVVLQGKDPEKGCESGSEHLGDVGQDFLVI